jgi:hypothetical protein
VRVEVVEGSTVGGMSVCVAVGGGVSISVVTEGSAFLQPATKVKTIITMMNKRTYRSCNKRPLLQFAL